MHADGLSRLIPKDRDSFDETIIASLKEENECEDLVCKTIRELPVTLAEIKKEAEKDEFITKSKHRVKNTSKNGKQISPFSICDDLLMYADRIVIPAVLRKKILREFHTGHPGISRMKTLLRGYVYWPGMDSEVEKYVQYCKGCQLAAKDPPIKTNAWPKTNNPWSRLHIDYAGPLKGFYYLVTVDSFSRWPEITVTRHPTTTNTVKILDELFSRFRCS